MKKVKNTETPLEKIREGKIKKNKQKIKLKLKGAVTEVKDLQLALRTENGATVKPLKDNPKKNKNKKANQEVSEDFLQESKHVENDKSKIEKQKKANKASTKLDITSKELTEAEVKKIEKKHAKKLAQKLKKQHNKLICKKENVELTTNGMQKSNILQDEAISKNIDSTSSKVLTKKEKKAQKRMVIKEQKLAEKQTRDPAVEASTVFVGNLPVNTKRVQLARLFQSFGSVNSIRLRSACGQVLHKHKKRKAAGSLNAYVVLNNKEAAEKAVSLNGVKFKENHLRITLAAKNPQRHEKEEAKKTIFVGNLRYSATEESLREIFSSCGDIDYVRCIRDGNKGCKGVAYVCFKSPDAVGLALELNETLVDERPINVERFNIKKLGAKEAREAQAEKEVNSKKGVEQRKNKNSEKDKTNQKQEHKDGDNQLKKPKKAEFRGVKVESLKKKQKSKKKKFNNQNLTLANKIAPKPKTE